MKITFKNQKELIVDYFSVAKGMMTLKTQWDTKENVRNLCEDPVATSEIIFEDADGSGENYR